MLIQYNNTIQYYVQTYIHKAYKYQVVYPIAVYYAYQKFLVLTPAPNSIAYLAHSSQAVYFLIMQH